MVRTRQQFLMVFGAMRRYLVVRNPPLRIALYMPLNRETLVAHNDHLERRSDWLAPEPYNYRKYNGAEAK
jgi:hypothetical protein